jgi:hypothetical protein
MALHDYMTGADIEFGEKPNPLASADMDLSEAYANAERRNRRKEIQKKIDNLEAQKKKLQDRLASVRAHSLSGMSDDDVVALAKSRRIRDQDIATWLHARGQMSARKTSAAQTKALEDAAAAEKERTKNELVQSIYDAETAYENAKAKERRPGDEEKATLEADSRAKKNRLDSLKKEFAKYGESWESYTSQQATQEQQTKTPKISENDNTPTENDAEEIELTDAEKKALGETKVGKFYEPTTKNQEKRTLKNEAQEAIRKKNEEEERKRKARKEQLDGIKEDLAIIGIKDASKFDASKLAGYVYNFENSDDRNDKPKAGAVARLKSFVGSDKEFKDWPSLKALFPESTKK